MILFSYIIIGMIAGLMSGLLGIGGGIIVVPALAWAFHYQHLPTEHLFHLAIGSSLTIMVATTISSALAHIKRGQVKWAVIERLLPGLFIGVISGAACANVLPRATLQSCFAIFILYLAIRLLVLARQPEQQNSVPLSRLSTFFCTLLIGGVAGLFGIGIGSLGIPFLLKRQIAMRHAAATIVTCTIPIALCGAISFLIAGWSILALPFSSGYLYWPAIVNVAVASIIMAPVGARLSYMIHTRWLKRIFALFLILVALSLFWE